MSIVSVSRRAGFPSMGHATFTQWSMSVSGDCPVGSKRTFSGNVTGRSDSGTGTIPWSGQWIMGIGAPQ